MVLAIDLGSNSLRAICMDKDFQILKSKEMMVGSARNLYPNKPLDINAKNRIKNALFDFSKEFDFKKNSVCVATEAFRIASDSDEFFDEIKKEFGLEFKIISGKAEARLVRLACEKRLENLNIDCKNSLFVDMGGASTEISYKDEFESFKFGIVRMFNESKMQNLENFAQNFTKNAANFIKDKEFDFVVLTSGVPTTLIALSKGIKFENYDKDKINGEKLRYNNFLALKEKILAMSQDQREKFLGKNRDELIICGIYLLKALFENHKDKEYIVIDDGLREGVCIASIENKFEQIIKGE